MITYDLTISESEIDVSVGSRFDKVALLLPDHTALLTDHAAISYYELANKSSAIAKGILHRIGVEWAPVAVLIHDPILRIAAILALLKANKGFSCLDHSFPKAHLDAIVSNLQPQIIICDAPCFKLACELACEFGEGAAEFVVDVEILRYSRSNDQLPDHTKPDTVAAIIYTSGSTGIPKGVMREHRMILNRARMAQLLGELTYSDRHLVLASSSFSAALNGVFNGLLGGCCVCLTSVEEIGVQRLANWLDLHLISALSMNVSLARHWLDCVPLSIHLPSIRRIQLLGSAALKRDAVALREKILGNWELWFTYSSTEATVCMSHIVPENSNLADGQLPIGKPNPDREIQILGANCEPVHRGAFGEVAVTSRYIAKGYWRMPELTKQKFLVHKTRADIRTFLTGDYGRINESGELELVGRLDDMVKIRGFRVDTSEVERTLLGMAHIKEAVVLTRESDGGEITLLAYVAPTSDFGLTKRDVRIGLAKRLPAYMLPSEIKIIRRFPLLTNGKLDRRGLVELCPDQEDDQPVVEPRNSWERIVLQAWCTVLNKSRIGIHDHFMDVGGDSFSATALEIELSRLLNKTVKLSGLATAPTIAEQAEFLTNSEDWADSPRPIPITDNDGADHPIFCLPANDGSTHHFRPLTRLLDRRAYSLVLPDLARAGHASDSLATIAHGMLAQVRMVQPHGPITIMASCNMCRLALQLCDELINSKMTVNTAILIDVPVTPLRFRVSSNKLANRNAWLRTILRAILRELRLSGSRYVLSLLWCTLKDITRRVTSPLETRMSANQKHLHNRLIELGDSFIPKPVDFKVIFVKGAWSQISRYYDGDSQMMGWDSLLKNAGLIVVPSSHSSMLKAPFVRSLARDLLNSLRQVNNQSAR